MEGIHMYPMRLLALLLMQLYRSTASLGRVLCKAAPPLKGMIPARFKNRQLLSRNQHTASFKRRKLSQRRRNLNKAVTLYRKMPLRTMSRAWGVVNAMDLPVWLRRPLLGLYAWMFKCNLEEAAVSDLTRYRNLGEFFRRSLKASARPVDVRSPLVLPSDGQVLHYGTVDECVVEQVKGVTYSLEGFFGPLTWSDQTPTEDKITDSLPQYPYRERLLHNPASNTLYHSVIYLAPGDYHRFHSPANWHVTFRRHFCGELLSVNPSVARWVQGLFNFNERAVYCGTWKHGFFSMTAVGATNVGSIKTYFDEELTTNKKKPTIGSPPWEDKQFFTETTQNGIDLQKGDPFGEFNLGSTIVLIFEAPKNFHFDIVEGATVRYGQPLGHF